MLRTHGDVLDHGFMDFWPTKYHTPHLPHGVTRYYRVFQDIVPSARSRGTSNPSPLRLPTALDHFVSDFFGYPLVINVKPVSLPQVEFRVLVKGCEAPGSSPYLSHRAVGCDPQP